MSFELESYKKFSFLSKNFICINILIVEESLILLKSIFKSSEESKRVKHTQKPIHVSVWRKLRG